MSFQGGRPRGRINGKKDIAEPLRKPGINHVATFFTSLLFVAAQQQTPAHRIVHLDFFAFAIGLGLITALLQKTPSVHAHLNTQATSPTTG
jgi:hypothetical protein